MCNEQLNLTTCVQPVFMWYITNTPKIYTFYRPRFVTSILIGQRNLGLRLLSIDLLHLILIISVLRMISVEDKYMKC